MPVLALVVPEVAAVEEDPAAVQPASVSAPASAVAIAKRMFSMRTTLCGEGRRGHTARGIRQSSGLGSEELPRRGSSPPLLALPKASARPRGAPAGKVEAAIDVSGAMELAEAKLAPGLLMSALGGTRTPSLLIRRPMPSVQPVRQNPDSQARIRRMSKLSARVRCCPSSL